jgi:hypothetical protein
MKRVVRVALIKESEVGERRKENRRSGAGGQKEEPLLFALFVRRLGSERLRGDGVEVAVRVHTLAK